MKKAEIERILGLVKMYRKWAIGNAREERIKAKNAKCDWLIGFYRGWQFSNNHQTRVLRVIQKRLEKAL